MEQDEQLPLTTPPAAITTRSSIYEPDKTRTPHPIHISFPMNTGFLIISLYLIGISLLFHVCSVVRMDEL